MAFLAEADSFFMDADVAPPPVGGSLLLRRGRRPFGGVLHYGGSVLLSERQCSLCTFLLPGGGSGGPLLSGGQRDLGVRVGVDEVQNLGRACTMLN